MKRLIYIITSIIITGSLASCQKVIDANLDESPAILTIEGAVPDSTAPYVRITRLIDVQKDNDFPAVTGADVTITDNLGNVTVLTQSTQGIYYGQDPIGVPGRTYTLKVIVNGEEYTARSTMPQKIYIDSLTEGNFGFGGNRKYPVINYSDPVGKGNNYRAVLWHNDTLRTDIFIEDDKYSDGNNREAILFSPEYQFFSGDKYIVEMQCIDRPVYEYFEILLEVDGSSGLASPANPASNISGGALGYFSAYTSHTLSRIVP